MSCKTNAPDELDAVNSRWNSVQDNAKQVANRYDRLVANWTGELTYMNKFCP